MAKKVTVKKDVCIGCGLCTSTAPELFQFGDDGLAEAVVADVPADLEASADEAAAGCPVQAIDAE